MCIYVLWYICPRTHAHAQALTHSLTHSHPHTVRAVLRLKRAYGAATAVTVVAADGATPLVVSNNSVTVEVEAGDLAVLAVELA